MTAADRPSVPQVGDTITTAEDLCELFAAGIEYVVVATGWQPWLVTSTEDGDLVAWTWADEDTPTGKWPVRIVEKLPYPLTLLAFPPGEPSRPSVTDNARADSAWIEWAQNLTGEYVTTTEEAREQVEELIAGLAKFAGLDRAAGRAETTMQSGYTVQQTAAHFARCVQRVSDRIRSTDYHRSVSDIAVLDNVEGFLDRIARDDLDVFAAGRAETTTATDEDATVEQVADALEHWDRGIDWRLAEQENLTRAAYLRGAEQLLGLLATARTRPTREQIAKAIHNSDIASGRSGTYRTGEGYYENADAVLALLADQPETTTEWAVRANDRWDQRVYPVADEQTARADRRAVNLVVVRREVTPWTEAGR